jgi:hypothetical protein
MNKTAGGLGFKPTVRNLFGIILANAEVYIKLMILFWKDLRKSSILR